MGVTGMFSKVPAQTRCSVRVYFLPFLVNSRDQALWEAGLRQQEGSHSPTVLLLQNSGPTECPARQDVVVRSRWAEAAVSLFPQGSLVCPCLPPA